jgi:hypothetical protein
MRGGPIIAAALAAEIEPRLVPISQIGTGDRVFSIATTAAMSVTCSVVARACAPIPLGWSEGVSITATVMPCARDELGRDTQQEIVADLHDDAAATWEQNHARLRCGRNRYIHR